jgi:hypothetical protein
MFLINLAKYDEVAAHPRVTKGTAMCFFYMSSMVLCIYALLRGFCFPEQGGYNPFVKLGRVIY